MLTDEHKKKRLGSAMTFTNPYSDEGDAFSNKIVTGDETWVFCHSRVKTTVNGERRHSGSPKKLMFKLQNNFVDKKNHEHCVLG